MNFDVGEVLSRAVRLTWRHKILWILILLPILPSFFFIPLFIAPLFLLGENSSPTAETVSLIVLLSLILVFILFSILFNTICMTSATLGVIRADREQGSLSFLSLLQGGAPYFARVLGTILIVGLGMGLVSFLFFLFVFAATLVTMGMAAICLQPVMILLTPLMFLIVGVMEGAQTAVISKDLGAWEAVKDALLVVRSHVWKYIILTLIIYFGSMILSSFITLPMMIPVFAIPFLMDPSAGLAAEMMVGVMVVFSLIFFPVMLAIQGLVGTFMKVTLDITYLRLAFQPASDSTALPEAGR
ncbi:MAG: hypothetical protein FJZ87_07080 [Chloroflexi bacterium]|nr:hypothetical protein [Chloroflexota bacterium]